MVLQMQMAETPRSVMQSTKAKMTKTLSVLSTCAVGVTTAVISLPSTASALSLPPCSDEITILKSIDNREVVLIGTAHISEESVELVRKVINDLKPDTVMIELDPKRLGRVGSDTNALQELGFDVPSQTRIALEKQKETATAYRNKQIGSGNILSKTLNSFKLQISSWASETAGSVLGKALGSFYKSVEKLGFEAGGEFKAAVEEGRDTGARVLLGDRDVDVTLERLASAILNTDPAQFEKVAGRIQDLEEEKGLKFQDDDKIDRQQMSVIVETLKQRDLIVMLMKELKQEVPLVYDALIGERDIYMAQSISEAKSSKSLVGVVGMAHMSGIENYLTKNRGFKVVKRNCPSS